MIFDNSKLSKWTFANAFASDAKQQFTNNNQQQPNQTTAKPLSKNRFGKNLFKITASYVVIIVVGITTFYYAKKEVDQNRIKNMKIKQEIFAANNNNEMNKYPHRLEILKKQN